MGVESDKLGDLVNDVYPKLIANLTKSITNIDDQLTELNDQKTAIEWTHSQIENDQTTRLIAKGFDLNEFGPDYGVIQVTDWILYTLLSSSPEFLHADQFRVSGDYTSIFTIGLPLYIDCGVDGFRNRIIDNSYFATGYTWVDLVTPGTAITVNIANVYTKGYEYLGVGWDSDPDIILNIDNWDDVDDHIDQPLGLSGTYGIDDRITKLNTARSIQVIDKGKYEDFITMYGRFAT